MFVRNAIFLALVSLFVGAAVTGLIVYSEFAVPLEHQIDKAAIQQAGCEVVKDLFVPARFKPHRQQFMFKQPETPIQ
jgi:hypothetical protein